MDEASRRGELEAAQQTIRFFETVLRASMDGIVITDASQKIILVNEAFCAFVGKRRNDVVETDLYVWLEHAGTDASAHWAELEERVQDDGMCPNAEFELTTPTGLRYFNVNASLVERIAEEEGGVIISLWRDITTRKRAEDERERAGLFMQMVIDGIPDPLMVINRDYTIALTNRPIRELAGEDPTAAGLRCHQVSHHRETPCQGKQHICPMAEVVETRAPVRTEHIHVDGDNEVLVEILSAPIFDDSGRVVQVIETSRDITERKRTEKKLKASLAEKEVLLREIHHRVKNNMQVVISLLRLQSRAISDPQARAAFLESQDRIKAMALVHETLYRSESLSAVSCRGYVEKLVREIARSHRGGSATLSAEISDVTVHIDQAVPLGLIVNELVSNAIEHAFPGYGPGEVKVTFRAAGEHELRLDVSDDGVGLPEEIDFETTDSLGLRLVARLARDQLGGRLEISSDDGTRFSVIFKKQTT
ncbi:MAG: PAS domain-containing protein [bacterium]|nr:PAS domain-containing protein [bacterium]